MSLICAICSRALAMRWAYSQWTTGATCMSRAYSPLPRCRLRALWTKNCALPAAHWAERGLRHRLCRLSTSLRPMWCICTMCIPTCRPPWRNGPASEEQGWCGRCTTTNCCAPPTAALTMAIRAKSATRPSGTCWPSGASSRVRWQARWRGSRPTGGTVAGLSATSMPLCAPASLCAARC